MYLRQYKADGTVFWNHVFVAALRNSEDKIINYVGIQHPLDKVQHIFLGKRPALMNSPRKLCPSYTARTRKW